MKFIVYSILPNKEKDSTLSIDGAMAEGKKKKVKLEEQEEDEHPEEDRHKIPAYLKAQQMQIKISDVDLTKSNNGQTPLSPMDGIEHKLVEHSIEETGSEEFEEIDEMAFERVTTSFSEIDETGDQEESTSTNENLKTEER